MYCGVCYDVLQQKLLVQIQNVHVPVMSAVPPLKGMRADAGLRFQGEGWVKGSESSVKLRNLDLHQNKQLKWRCEGLEGWWFLRFSRVQKLDSFQILFFIFFKIWRNLFRSGFFLGFWDFSVLSLPFTMFWTVSQVLSRLCSSTTSPREPISWAWFIFFFSKAGLFSFYCAIAASQFPVMYVSLSQLFLCSLSLWGPHPVFLWGSWGAQTSPAPTGVFALLHLDHISFYSRGFLCLLDSIQVSASFILVFPILNFSCIWLILFTQTKALSFFI